MQDIIQEIREAGARIKLIDDGDVAGAINTAFDHTGVDILFGSGGAPEGVLAAVALKCLGGEFKENYFHKMMKKLNVVKKWVLMSNKVLRMEDLVKGDDAIFAATGITDGELLKGVQFKGGHMDTQHIPSLCVQNQEQFVLLKDVTVWQRNLI